MDERELADRRFTHPRLVAQAGGGRVISSLAGCTAMKIGEPRHSSLRREPVAAGSTIEDLSRGRAHIHGHAVLSFSARPFIRR